MVHPGALFLFVLMLYVTVNNFSVMSRRYPVFPDLTSTKQQIRCFAKGHNTVTPPAVSLELANTQVQLNRLELVIDFVLN